MHTFRSPRTQHANTSDQAWFIKIITNIPAGFRCRIKNCFIVGIGCITRCVLIRRNQRTFKTLPAQGIVKFNFSNFSKRGASFSRNPALEIRQDKKPASCAIFFRRALLSASVNADLTKGKLFLAVFLKMLQKIRHSSSAFSILSALRFLHIQNKF